jgi:hypothetical protein
MKGKGKPSPTKPKITPVKAKAQGVKEKPKASVKVKNSYTLTGKTLTVNIGGKTAMISSSHANFKKVVGLVKSSHWSEAAKFLSIKELVAKAVKGAGKILEDIDPKDRVVKGKKDNRMAEKTLIDLQAGNATDYEPFYDRCKKNPNAGSVDMLFDFLKYIKAPIQSDGTFLAYKSVDHNFMDHHSHTFDNHPGNIVKMPRKDVVYSRELCSVGGLHVGAKQYVTDVMGKGHLLVVEVDPANVVSVPRDYEGKKMRVCEYKVIKEIPYN